MAAGGASPMPWDLPMPGSSAPRRSSVGTMGEEFHKKRGVFSAILSDTKIIIKHVFFSHGLEILSNTF